MFGIDFKMLGKKNITAVIDKQIDDEKIGELAQTFLRSIPLEDKETSHVVLGNVYSDGKLHISIYGAYFGCGNWTLTRCKHSYSFKNFLKTIISHAE